MLGQRIQAACEGGALLNTFGLVDDTLPPAICRPNIAGDLPVDGTDGDKKGRRNFVHLGEHELLQCTVKDLQNLRPEKPQA